MTENTIATVAETNAQQDAASDLYTGENVKVLRDAAHIRERPGMYIGDTGPKGLHHLVYELVYNSVDEALAGNRSGTKVTFKPDETLFKDATFDFDALEVRLRELAFLNKGLAITLSDERSGKEETFKAEGGVSEFVEYLNRTEDAVNKTIYVD